MVADVPEENVETAPRLKVDASHRYVVDVLDPQLLKQYIIVIIHHHCHHHPYLVERLNDVLRSNVDVQPATAMYLDTLDRLAMARNDRVLTKQQTDDLGFNYFP